MTTQSTTGTQAKTYDIDAIRTANKVRGKFFFERGAMRFFDSRILSTVHQGPGGVYFLTSERFHSSTGHTGPRCFTVRRFNPDTGDVSTAPGCPFNELTRSEATVAAKSYARGDGFPFASKETKP